MLDPQLGLIVPTSGGWLGTAVGVAVAVLVAVAVGLALCAGVAVGGGGEELTRQLATVYAVLFSAIASSAESGAV